MTGRKPTEKPTQNEVDRHLDRADRLIAEHRNESFDDPEEITSRTQVEEIARNAAAEEFRGRAAMPTPVQISIVERPSSTPPSVKKRNAKFGAIGGVLAGLAAVLAALSQCSHDVRNVKPAMHEAK